MGKQTKSKNSDNFGKGKVTPMQVAFIVDRYLSDNNYSETRAIFRNEASSLISKSPAQEAPKGLLSLGMMLDEYICLKEQKVMLDQERARLEQEKFRIQNLLQGMQNVMNAYNAGGGTQPPVIQPTMSRQVIMAPQSDPRRTIASPAGRPMYNTPATMPVSMPSSNIKERANLSTPNADYALSRKRMGSTVVTEAPPVGKKLRSKVSSTRMTIKDTNTAPRSDRSVTSQETAPFFSVVESSPHNRVPNGSLVQGSNVAKSLFNCPSVPTPPSTSGPKTPPPQAVSPQTEKSVSPLDSSSVACGGKNSTQEVTPTNCTIISSERVIVSPSKQMTCFTMERNHCISFSSPAKTNLSRVSKRNHVKGRLDFDGSDVAVGLNNTSAEENSTSESEKEVDIFDMDLPSLDAFGPDFSFSELLVDFDLDCEEIDRLCQRTLDASNSGSSHESGDDTLVADQVLSEFSSSITEVLSGKDHDIQGPDTLTAVKSVRKCIRIVSPAKDCARSLDGDNCLVRN